MVMPIILCGKSATGKDYIAKKLIQNHNFSKIITYTTRKPRDGERDGINYHFRDRDDFINMINNQDFFEYKLFESNNEYYGTSIESIDKTINCTGNNVLILEPEGVNKMIHAYNEKIFVVYLDTPEDILKERLLKRHPNEPEVGLERFMKEKNKNWKEEIERIDLCLDSSKDIDSILNDILKNHADSIENGIKKNNKVKKNKRTKMLP